jgi:hypothetical protein
LWRDYSTAVGEAMASLAPIFAGAGVQRHVIDFMAGDGLQK